MNKDYVLEITKECVDNARQSVMGYIAYNNLTISMQRMTQAFICAKTFESYCLQHPGHYLDKLFADFLYRFQALNDEFLSAIAMDNELIVSEKEFRDLEGLYKEIRQFMIT